jgi:hypothetical protein
MKSQYWKKPETYTLAWGYVWVVYQLEDMLEPDVTLGFKFDEHKWYINGSYINKSCILGWTEAKIPSWED